MFLDIQYERFYNPQRSCGHGSVVERLLPKQNVAGSNPAARSKRKASRNTLGALRHEPTHVKRYFINHIYGELIFFDAPHLLVD